MEFKLRKLGNITKGVREVREFKRQCCGLVAVDSHRVGKREEAFCMFTCTNASRVY
jgi:hypothetical protein